MQRWKRRKAVSKQAAIKKHAYYEFALTFFSSTYLVQCSADNLDSAFPDEASSLPISNDITTTDDCDISRILLLQGIPCLVPLGFDINSSWFNDEVISLSDIKCNASFRRKIASQHAMRSSNSWNSIERMLQKGGLCLAKSKVLLGLFFTKLHFWLMKFCEEARLYRTESKFCRKFFVDTDLD